MVRGQVNMAIALFVFMATLIAGSLLFILLEQAHAPIIDMANATSYANNSSRLQTGIERTNVLWDNWGFFVVVLSTVLGIVSAAFASRRPG